MNTELTAAGRRPNKRGVAAREKLLTTAQELLATGRPESVSINLVAREAGLSWGSVQNLFGDSDGFWSAVVETIIVTANDVWAEPVSDTIAGRVAEVADNYRAVLVSPQGIAVETVRVGLPRPLEELAKTHPKTAAMLTHLDELWGQAFLGFFEGIDVDPTRAADVASLLPSALRGMRADEVTGTSFDLARAHATLIAGLTAYLEG